MSAEDNEDDLCSGLATSLCDIDSSHDRFDPFLPRFEPTVEERSLQQSMHDNKESLKRKLMLRRSVAELADQGIYPPLKTPPAFAEQRKQLERAKAGDLLRKKLTCRPDRQCLIQHHILEDTNPLVESCVQQRQRQLKRSRLQENLSEHLVHRPGPLDLVSANILKVEPELQHAINEGKIQFAKSNTVDTLEQSDLTDWADIDDLTNNWQDFLGESFDSATTQDSPLLTSQPDFSVLTADLDVATTTSSMSDVNSPLSTTSPAEVLTSPSSQTSLSDIFLPSLSIPSPPDINPLLQGSRMMSNQSNVSRIPTPPDIRPLLQGGFSVPSLPSTCVPSSTSSVPKSLVSSRGSISKKTKPKIGTKTKVIKFHQYLGPKNSPHLESTSNVSSASADNTSFNILLQQQQMLLQWQLEFQQRNMPFVLSMKSENMTHLQSKPVFSEAAPVLVKPVTNSAVSMKKTRLEDMKVSELREECRRLNLPRSGAKPALVERLLPHADSILGNTETKPPSESGTSASDLSSLSSPKGMDTCSAVPMDVDGSSQTGFSCKTEPVLTSSQSTDIQPQTAGNVVPLIFVRTDAPVQSVPFANAITSANDNVVMATVNSTIPPLVVFRPSAELASSERNVGQDPGVYSRQQNILINQQQPLAQRLPVAQQQPISHFRKFRQPVGMSQEMLIRQLMSANGHMWTNGMPPSVNPSNNQMPRTNSVLNPAMSSAFEQKTPFRRCSTNPFISQDVKLPTAANAYMPTTAAANTANTAQVPMAGTSQSIDDVLEVLMKNGEMQPDMDNCNAYSSSSIRPSFFLPATSGAVTGHMSSSGHSADNAIVFDTPSLPDMIDIDWYGNRQRMNDDEALRLSAANDIMDMSSWLDDVLPAAPAECGANADLFNIDDCDLCAPGDGMRATFEKLMEVSTSKS